jgi:hypothetical protein
MTLLLQAFLEDLGHFPFIFDNQDTHPQTSGSLSREYTPNLNIH